MLQHILVHHRVVEFERALLGYVVVDLALLRLDHKCSFRIDTVGQRVVLEVDVARPLLLKEVVLVLPAGLLVVHEAACWALMLISSAVELAHHLIERVIVGRWTTRFTNRGSFALIEKSVELCLNARHFIIKGLVLELVGALLGSGNGSTRPFASARSRRLSRLSSLLDRADLRSGSNNWGLLNTFSGRDLVDA